jgi:predicted extracellular nuclease
MWKTYQIASWNLENLFNIENYPGRTEKLQRTLGDSIKGRTQAELDGKLDQLASIIKQMNNGHGPDILGVCEVEDKNVLDLLVQRLAPIGKNYGIVHHESPDQRGIDVAFIYDADFFSVEAVFDHFVMRRTATRDILQVNFMTSQNRRLVLLANHWPSRSGNGPWAYRAIAGETLAYFHQRIAEEAGADTPVLAMGDFNDQPFDESITTFALAMRSRTKVTNARNQVFYNLMWEIMDEDAGTLYFNNEPFVFDQFLANKNIIKTTGNIRIVKDSLEIIRFPEMVTKGEYPQPIAYGGLGNPVNPKGFSDHFPIGVKIEEKS